MLVSLEYFVDNQVEKPKYMIDLDSDHLYEGKYNFTTFMCSLDTVNPRKILKQLKKGKFFVANDWKYNKSSSFTSKSKKLTKLCFKAGNRDLMLIYNND